MVTKNSKKKETLFYFIAGIIIVVLLNIINTKHFFRLDLTEEKRYTISEASKEVLKGLDDVVYVTVYLDGDLPAGFKRLKRSIRETLNEMQVYGAKNIRYQFVDPSAEVEEKKRNQFYYSLIQKGIQPTNLFTNEDGKKAEKLIFPGAIISYQNKEAAVILLKGNSGGASPDEVLNQSIENAEFEFVNAIQAITAERKKKIAYLTGNAELDSLHSADLTLELNSLYKVKRVNLREVPNLDGYDAILVVKPKWKFNDDEKLKIDQFVVNGGKAAFFVDAVELNMDSMSANGTVALPVELNLDDLFFKWGVRLNKDLIQDMNCGYLPMTVGMMGDKPQIQMVNWRYFPIINGFAKNPIVRHMDGIYTRFVGSIDSIKADGIRKTPLMFTSQYCKTITAPAQVSLNEMREEPKQEQFNKQNLAVAYLLEGKFKSAYASRPLFQDKIQGLVNQNKESRIVICADGDLLANDFDYQKNQIIPLGFDKYTQKKFANRDFMMNMMAYLFDDKGLINVRSKEITLRPLDKVKVKEEKTQWQIINILLPVLAVIGFAFGRAYWRKNKYTKF